MSSACDAIDQGPRPSGGLAAGRTGELPVAHFLGCILVVSGLLLAAGSAAARSGEPTEPVPTWDSERYVGLVEESETLYEQAQTLEGEARAQLLDESLTRKEAAFDILRDALAAGLLDDYGDLPRTDLYNLLQNIVALSIQLERCEAADQWLDSADVARALFTAESLTGLEALRETAQACRERLAAAEAPPEPPAEAAPPEEAAPVRPRPPQEPLPEDRPQVLPWVLVGLGGGLIAGGVIYDVLLDDERSDFEAIQGRCAIGCSASVHTQGLALQEDLETAKWVTGLLYGTGAATAVTGLVLYFVGRDEDGGRPSMSLAPVVGPGAMGAALRVPF